MKAKRLKILAFALAVIGVILVGFGGLLVVPLKYDLYNVVAA
jgi:hypothetical protein